MKKLVLFWGVFLIVSIFPMCNFADINEPEDINCYLLNGVSNNIPSNWLYSCQEKWNQSLEPIVIRESHEITSDTNGKFILEIWETLENFGFKEITEIFVYNAITDEDIVSSNSHALWVLQASSPQSVARLSCYFENNGNVYRFRYLVTDAGKGLQQFMNLTSKVMLTNNIPSHFLDIPKEILEIIANGGLEPTGETCCSYYSSGNCYPCCSAGNCTWWCRYKRTDIANCGWGNAKEWIASAQSAGFPTGSTPLVGSIMVMDAYECYAASYGHVAYVESVNGSNITVSEMGCESWYCARTNVVSSSCGSLQYIYTKTGGGCNILNWEFSGSDYTETDGWTTNSHMQIMNVSDGVIDLDPKNCPDLCDPMFLSPSGLCVSAATYPRLEIRMKSSTYTSAGDIFFQRSVDSDFSTARRIIMDFDISGAYTYYNINMAANSNWNGTISRLRIDPPSGDTDGSWDHHMIDYIRFSNCCMKDNWQWNTYGDKEGWTAVNCTIPGTQPVDGHYLLYPSTNDPQFISPRLCESTNDFDGIRLGIAAQTSSNKVQIFFSTDTETFFSEDKSKTIYVTNDGGWYSYEVELGDNPKWTGIIRKLRIDPPNGPNIMGFDYVELIDGTYLPPADTDPPVWDTTTGIQAVTDPMNCDGILSLSWNTASDLTTPVTYNIYRDILTGFTPDAITYVNSTTGTSYEDLYLTPGQTYYYVVRAQDAADPANEDDNIVELSGTATDSENALAPVTGLMMDTAGNMEWVDSGALEVKYNIYRSTNADYTTGVTMLGETVDGNTTTFVSAENPANPGDCWFYKVKAVDECGQEMD